MPGTRVRVIGAQQDETKRNNAKEEPPRDAM